MGAQHYSTGARPQAVCLEGGLRLGPTKAEKTEEPR